MKKNDDLYLNMSKTKERNILMEKDNKVKMDLIHYHNNYHNDNDNDMMVNINNFSVYHYYDKSRDEYYREIHFNFFINYILKKYKERKTYIPNYDHCKNFLQIYINKLHYYD